MNNIKTVILSTLVVTTAIANTATPATAQGYYPNNPTSNQPNYPSSPNNSNFPNSPQPNYPNNPGSPSGSHNPNQQVQSPNAASSLVGQWRCQEQYQDQNSRVYIESVLAINPNQQFEMQGSGTVQMANGTTSQLRSQGQGNWNTNNSKVHFTGQLNNTMNNGVNFQQPIQAEYSVTAEGTLASQVNAQGASNTSICQRI